VTVLATGATFEKTGYSPLRPDRAGIPGLAGVDVLDPVEVLANPARAGQRVLVVDGHGDYAAVGAALALAQAGRSVEIVTPQMFVGAGIVAATVDLPWVSPQLAAHGVTLTPQTFVDRVEGTTVTLAGMWGGDPWQVQADTIVLNTARRPNAELAEALTAAGIQAERIGDCRVPREIDDAIYEGERTGRRLGEAPVPA
jgi:hypothetical protein